MRLILTFVILSITSISIAFGQGNNTSATDKSEGNNTEQSESSPYFYINERGLAVYKKNPADATTSKTYNKTDLPKSEPILQKDIPETNTNIEANINKAEPIDNSRTSSLFIKKDTKPVIISSAPKEKEVSSESEEVVTKRIISTLGKPNQEEIVETKDVYKEETSVKETSSGKKKSVFDRKRESQYKTLEEAALAVEALLEDLKKDQQAHSNSAGSMSARLSRGANKSLRKNASNPSSDSARSKSNETNKNSGSRKVEKNTEAEIINDEFDNLPSYFINGELVEKADIDRLRKKDIISKEVRIRNTVTGNPNGEVWYEVK